MSLDRSLKVKNALTRHRNVLTRAERIEKLKDEEKWEAGASVLGLPKVGHRKIHAAKKEKEVGAEGAAAVPGAPGAPAAAGAAGAKAPAAGGKAAAPAAGAKAPAAGGAKPAAKAAEKPAKK